MSTGAFCDQEYLALTIGPFTLWEAAASDEYVRSKFDEGLISVCRFACVAVHQTVGRVDIAFTVPECS